ncbi:hypothetical protein AWC38_SpisGene7167 [Stylophora pistillata]|uniref:GIY-YIG domain-containing protein n=1 Tax=Stylophora pistillata TaxID=50429 RepID=A0A2B4SFH9_STYPI|nr:hypothetical protein AWC38_SpisGene7167 [Stylophora pistillata]
MASASNTFLFIPVILLVLNCKVSHSVASTDEKSEKRFVVHQICNGEPPPQAFSEFVSLIKVLTSKTPTNLALFRSLRNRVTYLMNKARQEYHRNLIDDMGNDQRKLFEASRSLLNLAEGSTFPPSTDYQVLATDFGEFFVQEISGIKSMISSTAHRSSSSTLPAEFVTDASFSEFELKSTNDEQAITLSSAKKSCLLDPIPTTLLVEHLDVLLPTITRMINLSLSTGHFPDSWKLAIVRPLLKKAEQSYVDNRYKRNLLTTMLDRAYRLSSSWLYFSEECERLKNLFSRLDYPHHLINSAINTFINSRIADQQPLQALGRLAKNDVTRVVIPFKDQDSANIVKTQLKDLSIKLQTTIQPVFVSRKIGQDLKECETKPQLVNQQCVVYQFKCNLCDTGSYVGYTRGHLYARVDSHKSTSSSVRKHYDNDHAGAVPEDLLSCFKVLKKCMNKFDCLVNEMLYIKQLTPSLNVQTDSIRAKVFV